MQESFGVNEYLVKANQAGSARPPLRVQPNPLVPCSALWPIIIGSVLYPWVNFTGIRILNPRFRESPLTHGYKTDPIMIHKRVTGASHVLFLHIIIGGPGWLSHATHSVDRANPTNSTLRLF